MSVGQLGQTLWSANALVDLTGKLFHFMTLDPTTGQITPAVAGGTVVGVLYEEATLGNPATIQLDSIAKVVCGATVTAGTRVASDEHGAAFPSNHYEFEAGTALTAGATGDVIPVLLAPGRSAA